MTREIKIYNCGYNGGFESSRRNVRAYNSEEAKQYFAAVFGGDPARVVARHHDVISLNDRRRMITEYDAEHWREGYSRLDQYRADMKAGFSPEEP